VLSLVVHVDRIPADLRDVRVRPVRAGGERGAKKNGENEGAGRAAAQEPVFDTILAGTKGALDDGKDLSVKLFADPKSDDLSAEVTFSAKSGTVTAKNFAAMGKKTSLPRDRGNGQPGREGEREAGPHRRHPEGVRFGGSTSCSRRR
jgi:hypothetical protein